MFFGCKTVGSCDRFAKLLDFLVRVSIRADKRDD